MRAEDNFMKYHTGSTVLKQSDCSSNVINHAILIVGFDVGTCSRKLASGDPDVSSSCTGGHWICRNQWGTQWGYGVWPCLLPHSFTHLPTWPRSLLKPDFMCTLPVKLLHLSVHLHLITDLWQPVLHFSTRWPIRVALTLLALTSYLLTSEL